MRFESVDELNQKVAGSICMIDDKGPYYIIEFSSKHVTYIDEDNNHQTIQGNPKRYTYRPPVLGNIQVENKVYYVTRTPVRRYKVGLSNENCVPNNLMRNVPYYYICKGLKEAAANFYEKQLRVEEFLKAGFHVALSKKYSISRKGVFYRGECIANATGRTLTFSSRYDMDFHSTNLMSLIQGWEYTYEEHKELQYGKDDI